MELWEHPSETLPRCLFFSAGRLARILGKMAEEAFEPSGLPPSYAFALLVIAERRDITQNELATTLSLSPSTLTRFLDKLEEKGLVERHPSGKTTRLTVTPTGQSLRSVLGRCWKTLQGRYQTVLGPREGRTAAGKLENLATLLEPEKLRKSSPQASVSMMV